MKKKELGITKGEVHINDCFQTEVWSKNTKVASCNNGINSGIYKAKTDEEMKANATLIADAFNTANKCGLMPSEFLEQRDELIAYTKSLIEYINSRRSPMTTEKQIIRKLEAIINQIEQ